MGAPKVVKFALSLFASSAEALQLQRTALQFQDPFHHYIPWGQSAPAPLAEHQSDGERTPDYVFVGNVDRKHDDAVATITDVEKDPAETLPNCDQLRPGRLVIPRDAERDKRPIHSEQPAANDESASQSASFRIPSPQSVDDVLVLEDHKVVKGKCRLMDGRF